MSGPITGTKYSGINKVTGALAGEANKLKDDLRKLSDGVLTERPLNDRDFVGGKNKDAKPGDSGVHEAAVPKRQLARVPTPNQPNEKKDEKDKRVVTGSSNTGTSKDAGDDADVQILIGDNSLSTVDPMFFAFGGTLRQPTGISTSCPSWCQNLVDQYNKIASAGPLTLTQQNRLKAIKDVDLPLCELENCGDEDEWFIQSQFLQVFGQDQLNPYSSNSLLGLQMQDDSPSPAEPRPMIAVPTPTQPPPSQDPDPDPPADEPEPDQPVTSTPLVVTTSGNPSFVHTVGSSPCPQSAGSIGVSSNNGNPLTVSNVAVGGSLSSRLNTRVSGNNSSSPSIVTDFNCSSAANGSFSGNTTATVTDQTTGESQQISVAGSGRVQ
jgi:hypothetical protein